MTAAGTPAAAVDGDTDAVLYRSAMLVSAKRPEQAESLLRQSLAVHPGDARMLAALSEVVLRRGCPADAAALARAAVTARPAALTWTNLSRVLLAGHDTPGALAAAQRAIELEPRHPEPYCLAALSLAATGGYSDEQHAQARGLVQHALEVAPPSTFACVVAGDVERLHDPGAARTWYEKALELEPMNTVAMMRLADAQGSTESQGVSLVLGVLALDPLNLSARARLAEPVVGGLRRFAALGQLAALLTAFGAAWVPANGVAVVVLVAATALLLGVRRALHDASAPLPAEFRRAVRWGTTRARVVTVSCLATPLLAVLGLGSLLVRGGRSLSSDVLLALAVVAAAPATLVQLRDLHDRVLVEGLPEPLRREVTQAVWRLAARPPVVWALLAVVAVGLARWAPDPAAAGLFAVLVALMTLPLATSRLLQERRSAAGARRGPSGGALVLAAAGVAELAAGVVVTAVVGRLG